MRGDTLVSTLWSLGLCILAVREVEPYIGYLLKVCTASYLLTILLPAWCLPADAVTLFNPVNCAKRVQCVPWVRPKMKIDNVQDGIVMNQHSGTFKNDGAGRSIAGRKGKSVSGKHVYYPEVINNCSLPERRGQCNQPANRWSPYSSGSQIFTLLNITKHFYLCGLYLFYWNRN